VRILQVPHAYAPVRGGAEYYITRVSEALAALGHDVHVFTTDFASPEGFYQLGVDRVGAPREVRRGVSVTRCGLTTRRYRLAGRLPATPAFVRQLAEARVLETNRRRFRSGLQGEIDVFKPDVVMALPHLFPNVRAVLEEQLRRPFPLILVPMLHEGDPYWSVDDVAEALAQANGVIALTAHEAHRINAAYGVPESAIFTCSAGVDLPCDPRPAERSELVLFLGRKVLAKGLEDLVNAMQLIWPDHPSAQLVLAGSRTPGTDQVDHLVQALAPEERARVTSLDDISEEAKHALLSSARCLVLPSEIESLGLVVLEAWAHGTAVVTLDLPVFRNLVEPGEDGLLVIPKDPTQLAQAIRSLLANNDRARSMGEAGRRKAERMTWETVASCVVDAIDHAVNSAKEH